MTEQELEGLENIRQSILCTTERAKSAKQLETAMWGIWNSVKLNEGSMVPEKQLRLIRNLLEQSNRTLQVRLEETVASHERTRSQLRKAKKELQSSRKKTTDLGLRLSEAREKLKNMGVKTSRSKVALLGGGLKDKVKEVVNGPAEED